MKKNYYDWRKIRYCIFKMFFHLVFVTKYRKKVFTNDMLRIIKEDIGDSCKRMDAQLLEFGGEEDHIHLLVSCSSKISLCNFVARLKGASARKIRGLFSSQLRKKLWGANLWSPSYCIVSCGGAPLKTIKQYVKGQLTPTS